MTDLHRENQGPGLRIAIVFLGILAYGDGFIKG